MKWSKVPDSLYPLIFSYLSRSEQVQASCTCSQYYESYLKGMFRVIKPKYVASLIRAREYRIGFLSVIRNPYNQLDVIDGTDALRNTFDSEHLISFDVRRLSIFAPSYFLIVPRYFKRIQILMLCSATYSYSNVVALLDDVVSRNQLPDPAENMGLKELHLDSCEVYDLKHRWGRKTTEEIDSMITFPYLPCLEKLSITDMSLLTSNSLSPYSHLRFLELKKCPNIIDVTPFGSIYHLILHKCEGIVDVSPLKRNHKIEVINCLNITSFENCFDECKYILLQDIRGYEVISTINLSHYGKVIEFLLFFTPRIFNTQTHDIEALRTTFNSNNFPPTLRRFYLRVLNGLISPTPRVSICELSTRLYEIRLDTIDTITSMHGLGRIPKVHLQNLKNLVSLNGLGADKGNKVVIIEGCDQVSDFSPLKDIERVEIATCAKFKDCEQVSGVKYLHLTSLMNIINSSSLCNAIHLIFHGCIGVLLKGLKNVSIVEISANRPMSDIDELGNNDKIVLEGWFHSLNQLNRMIGIDMIREHYQERLIIVDYRYQSVYLRDNY